MTVVPNIVTSPLAGQDASLTYIDGFSATTNDLYPWNQPMLPGNSLLSIASSATFQNLFTIPLAANGVYNLQFQFSIVGSNPGGLSVSFAKDSNITLSNITNYSRCWAPGSPPTLVGDSQAATLGSSFIQGTGLIYVEGCVGVKNGATAGNLYLQIAQASSNATATVIAPIVSKLTTIRTA